MKAADRNGGIFQHSQTQHRGTAPNVPGWLKDVVQTCRSDVDMQTADRNGAMFIRSQAQCRETSPPGTC